MIPFGPSPADQEWTQAFIASIGPDSMKKRALIVGFSFGAALIVLFGYGVVGGYIDQAVNASALILDIGGAVILVTGLLMPRELIAAMSVSPLGGNEAIAKYWEATRADAKVALVLLVLGFAGQILADVMS